MKRKRAFALGFGALVAAGLWGYGCSANDTSGGGSPSAGGSVNTGGSSNGTGGSSSNTGGSSSSTGGSSNTGGSSPGTGGAVGTGGSTGTGGVSTGAGGAPPAGDAGVVVCPSGIKSGTTACTTTCGPKACGLADQGSTTCNCPAGGGVYTCTKCAFNVGPNTPSFVTTPPTTPCGTTQFDANPCTTMGDACICPMDLTVPGPTGTPVPAPCLTGASTSSTGVIKTQECACWPRGTAMALQWDCDTQPGL